MLCDESFVPILYRIDRALVIGGSTLRAMNCLAFSLGRNCASGRSGAFSIRFEQGSGECRDLRSSDFSTSTIQLMLQPTRVPVISSTDLCYRANLVYDGTIVDTQSNLNCNACPMNVLSSFLASGVSMQLDGEASSNNVSHLTTATLSCASVIEDLSGSPKITCIDGNFEPAGLRYCGCKSHSLCFTYTYKKHVHVCSHAYVLMNGISAVAVWLIVVIILIILALGCAIGIICGSLTARCMPSLPNGLVESK